MRWIADGTTKKTRASLKAKFPTELTNTKRIRTEKEFKFKLFPIELSYFF